ncbi:hypothetical protein R1sor_024329 [Riccia sorocarpa]|uniref:SAP domain-containing protein n=1 Tax=Riccia sorocarpa TaxID=122646 RepID=A0ABD3GQD0_9MARC
MITRRKAALLQALPLTDRTNQVSAETDLKQKCDQVELSEDTELSRKMQVITLSSDESSDDDPEEESESDYLDENEASAISQSSEVSALDDSSGDEGCSLEDNDDVVVQPSKLPGCSIDSLIAKKVLQTIKEGGDHKNLTVDSCRSYLRYYGLRISGNKAVLIERIQQHIELRQGVPEKYGLATFTINCTGDVCTGDVVKFKQKVYKSFSVIKRSADPVGQRTVVGRVVKESYGEKKQQHTFTVEVLWSSGYEPLPPMHQLLVKGRNLYKLKTYRQMWEDESIRKISLDEKHERGDAARSKRRGNLRASGPRKSKVGRRKELPNPYVAMGADQNFHRAHRRGSPSRGRPQRRCFPVVPSVIGQENPVVPRNAGSLESRQTSDYRSAVTSVLAREVANNKTHQPPAHKRGSASDAEAAASRSQDRIKEDFSTHKVSTTGLLGDMSFQSLGRADSRNSEVSSSSWTRDIRGSPFRLQSKIVSAATTCSERKQKEVRPQRSDLLLDGQVLPTQGLLPLAAQPLRIPSQRTDPFMDGRENQSPSFRNHSSFSRDSPAEVPSFRALSPGMPNRGVLREASRSVSARKEHRSPRRHEPERVGGSRNYETGNPPLRQPWDQAAEARHNFSGGNRQTKHRRIDVGEVAPGMQASPLLHQTGDVGAAMRQPLDHGDEACHNLPGSRRNSKRMDVGERIRQVQGPPVRPASTKEQVKCLTQRCPNSGSVSCSFKVCAPCCSQLQLGRPCSNANHARANRKLQNLK